MKRFLAILLVIAMLPIPATFARAAEPAVISEEACADVWETIEAIEAKEVVAKRGKSATVSDYMAIVDDVIAAVEASDTFAEGSIHRNGAFFTWETTDGTVCGYSPRLRARIRNTAIAGADPEDFTGVETTSYATKGGSPSSTDVAVFQPYYGLDSSFKTTYPNEGNSIAQALGGSSTTYKTTAATIDAIADAFENCGVVIFDSHGDTDYANPSNDEDFVSKANTSYICLQSGTGLTSADQASVTGTYGSYYHAYYAGSYESMKYYCVDGTAIANHMEKTAPNNMLWSAICLGMATDGLHAPLRAKGVEVCYGYSQSVTFDYDYQWEEVFWDNMIAGKTVAQSAAEMKSQVGDWDYISEYTTISSARSNFAAFPIFVSSEDVYPGKGNVDNRQTVKSTWTLKGSTTPTEPTTAPTEPTTAPTEPTEPIANGYVLTSSLKSGDQVIIYNPGNGKALTTEMNGYYVAGADVTPANNVISNPNGAAVWTVTANANGTYTFKSGSNELSADSTVNGDKTYNNLYVEAGHKNTWKLETCNAANNTFVVYNAAMAANYGHIYLEWYAAKSGFSAYDTSEDRATEQNFGFQFYVKSGSVTPTEPTTAPTEPTTAPTEPTTAPITGDVPINEGDCVVIYNAASGVIIGYEEDTDYDQSTGNYTYCNITTEAVTLSGSTLKADFENAGTFYVIANEDGTYAFLDQYDYDQSEDPENPTVYFISAEAPDTYYDNSADYAAFEVIPVEGGYLLKNVADNSYYAIENGVIVAKDLVAGDPNFIFRFAIWDGTTEGDDTIVCTLAGGAVTPTQPTTAPTEPTTAPSGNYVAIYYPASGKVMTTESYLYNNSKTEMCAADATLANGKLTTSATNVALFEMTTANGVTIFKTADGKYLEADGTNVQLVSAQNDNTKFVLEASGSDYFIRCNSATFNGKAQYIEYYRDYFTVYSFNSSNSAIYTFNFYPVDNGGTTPTEPTTAPTEPTTAPTQPTTAPTEPTTAPTEPTTAPSGNYVAIYYPASGKVMTTESYLYNNSKTEMCAADATLANGKLTTSATNVALFEMTTANGVTIFKTADGKYLEADGTNVQLVSAQNDNTKFVLEASGSDYFIRCNSATFNGKAQYIEYYRDYFTVYSFNSSNSAIYTFNFYPVDNGGTTPTEPTTAPTEPTTAPTEPTTAPTQPTTAPTEPTTAPTQPTTAPTEPTTAPTQPTTAPTDYKVTIKSDDEAHGRVTMVDNVVTATPDNGFYAAGFLLEPADAATVLQSGNSFYISNITKDCTLTIQFREKEAAELRFSVPAGCSAKRISTWIDEPTALKAPEGEIRADMHEYKFLGWTEERIKDEKERPVYYTDSFTPKAALTTLYALYTYEYRGETFYTTVLQMKTCLAKAFNDVDVKAWYHEALDFVLEYGYMNGVGDFKFNPNGKLTRGMMVTILYRLEEREGKFSHPFTDIARNAWYADAVAWAYESGVVNGTSTTTFSPDAPITREQTAAMLYRYAKWNGEDVTPKGSLMNFVDANKVSAFARDPMRWAVGEGIIHGKGKIAEKPTGTDKNEPTDILDPLGTATRAEIAQILYGWLN